MEIKDLTGFVLLIVLVGMLLGVGIVIFDKFGDLSSETATVTNESVTVTANAGSLTGSSILTVTRFADNVTEISSGILTNETITWNSVAGSFVTDTNWTAATTYYVDYTYDKDSTTTTTMASLSSAVSPIAATWLPLIIVVAILAIVLG